MQEGARRRRAFCQDPAQVCADRVDFEPCLPHLTAGLPTSLAVPRVAESWSLELRPCPDKQSDVHGLGLLAFLMASMVAGGHAHHLVLALEWTQRRVAVPSTGRLAPQPQSLLVPHLYPQGLRQHIEPQYRQLRDPVSEFPVVVESLAERVLS